MAIKATQRGGADAGRGDDPHSSKFPPVPKNPHGIPQSSADDWGKAMGVPSAWVKGPREAEFSGSVKGFTGDKGKGQLWLSSESTGGDSTDSHLIDFSHPFMNSSSSNKFNEFFGVNPGNPGAGKKWNVKGSHIPAGPRADDGYKMHWTLH